MGSECTELYTVTAMLISPVYIEKQFEAHIRGAAPFLNRSSTATTLLQTELAGAHVHVHTHGCACHVCNNWCVHASMH